MLDLQACVRDWRQRLERTGAFRPWQLDELEDHLTCALEDLVERGGVSEATWSDVVARVGRSDQLVSEYAKGYSRTVASRLLGVAFAATLFVALSFLSVGSVTISNFVHLGAAVFVLGLVFGGLVAGFGPSRVVSSFREALGRSDGLDLKDVTRLRQVLRRGYRLSWSSGVIVSVIGVIQVLSNVTSPAEVGAGLALSTLSLLYGALLAELCFANLDAWISSRVVGGPERVSLAQAS